MSRILTLFEQRENRRLLAEVLGVHHEIVEGAGALAEPFDLCLVDGVALERLGQEVRARKEKEEPLFLPILLVTARADVGLVTRHLWKSIDDLINSPIDKLELQARVESLLRTRRLSVELHNRSEERFRHLYEQATDGIFLLSSDNRFVDANQAGLNMLGCTRAELRELRAADVVAPYERPRLQAERAFVVEGRPYLAEWVGLRKDGSTVCLEASASQLSDGSFVAIVRDLTERKRAELALREAEARLRLAVRAGDVGLWDWDVRTDEVYVSPEYKRQLGYEDHEIGNDLKVLQSLVHPDDFESAQVKVRACQSASHPNCHNELRLRHKDGSYRWIMSQGTMLFDEAGKPVRMLGSHVDITERKRAEQEREELSLRNAALVAALGQIVYDWRTPSNQLTWGGNFTEVLGYTPEEMGHTTQSWTSRIHPEDLPVVLAELAGASREQRTFDCEYRFRHRDGSYRWMHDRGVLMVNAEGDLERVVGVFMDVSRRKQAEELLRRSQERLAFLVHGTPAMIYTAVPGDDFSATFISDNVTQQTGYEPGEFVADGGFWASRIHPDDAPRVLAEFQALLNGSELLTEYRFRFKDGSYHWMQDGARLVHDDHRAPAEIVGYWLDVSERRRAEEALRESHEHLRAILDNMFPFVGLFSTDGLIIEVNRPSLEVSNLRPEDVVGKPCAEVFWFTHSSTVQAAVRDALARAARGEIVRSDVPVRIAGDQRITIDLMFGPLRDSQGKVVQIVGSAVDVTERKQLEEQLREALRVQQTLLHEVHHRVKNNLQIITSLLRLQERQCRDESTRGMIQECRLRVEAMARIHETLYQSGELGRVDFADYGRRIVRELMHSYRGPQQEIGLETQFESLRLELDTAIPCGLILNELVSNAFKHAFVGRSSGQLVVTLRHVTPEQLLLRVADDGVGFPPDWESRLCGSLGLVLVRLLAQQLRGQLSVRRREARTEVEVVFPRPPSVARAGDEEPLP